MRRLLPAVLALLVVVPVFATEAKSSKHQRTDEQKKPWIKTMDDMRIVSLAIDAYAIDHGDAYPSSGYEALEPLLEPTYVKKMPALDMWKHPYAYVLSDDHRQYRIVSAGADKTFEPDSLRFVPNDGGPLPTIDRDSLDDDLILENGEFVQAPVQAKEKAK